MGLEMVELVMAVEDEFGIAIPDEEASECRTVGKLYELVLSKLRGEPHFGICPTAHLFYRLRRGLTAMLGGQAGRPRPSDSLDALLPRQRRQQCWRRLAVESDLVLPELRPSLFWRTVNLMGLLIGVGFIWSIWVLTVGRQSDWYALPLISGGFVGLLTYAGTCGLTRPYYAAVPAGCMALGDLTKAVVQRNYVLFGRAERYVQVEGAQGARKLTSWSAEAKHVVYERLLDLVAQELAVPRSKLSPATDFLDDLFA